MYVSGMYASTNKLSSGLNGCTLATGFPVFLDSIASFNICEYKSNPTESMKPCCCEPNILPAPRIDKSRIAILNPDPNSVNSLIACNLFSDTSVKILSLRYVKYARSEEHTSELQSRFDLVCRLLLEKKNAISIS